MKQGSTLSVLLLVCFLVAGCAAVQKAQQMLSIGAPPPEVQKPPADEPKPSAERSGQKQQATVEQLEFPKFERVAPPKPLPPSTPLDAKQLVHVGEPVNINIDSMPLSELIIHALGGMLKVNLYIDEQVKNMKDPITIRTGEPLPPYRALEVILGVLESKNLYFEARADTLFVYRTRPGVARPAEIRVGPEVPDSPAEILQVVVLKYARPIELEPILREVYKSGVAIKIHPRENALIFSGQAASIKAMMELVQFFDVPYVQGKKAFIIKLQYWQPDEFAKQLSQVLEGIGINIARSSRDPGILFVPIKFLNSLLVLAPDDASARVVLEWRERLDTAESAGTEERAFTYVPDFAKASELVESIQRVYGIVPTPLAAQAPGLPPARVAGQIPMPSQPQAPTPSAPGLPTPSGAIPGLKISADERRNVVLIVTNPISYRNVLILLKELDTPAKQVLMETTIAELTLTDDLSLGFEFFIKQKIRDGTLDISTLGAPLAPLAATGPVGPAGLTLQYISAGEKFAALINALQTQNRISVLSRPRLTVMDNQEATIQVGSDVPTVSSVVDTVSSGVQTNIQYRSTGIILRIKPTINAKGLLTLNVSQEISNATISPPGFLGAGQNSPTIQTRKVQTTVVAADGQTVVLGGLMSDDNTRGQTKVPWLGDIPVFGFLFRNETTNRTKTELIILISPRILASVEDTTRATEEFKQELRWLK